MSGHSGFAPIGGNIPVINLPQIGQIGGQENIVENASGAQQAPEVREGQEQNRPDAGSLAQKLDAMLLRAANMSTKTVSVTTIKEDLGVKLGKKESKALEKAATAAQEALDAISEYTGRQIASSLIADDKGVFDWSDNEVARALQKAIDAQADLSVLLHDLANRADVNGKAFDRISELALRCDRRQSEIFSLSMQLADAVAQAGDDPQVVARLDATLTALLPRQAMSMHGNVEMLEKLKTSLQPLADTAESFKNRPNASLTSEEFMRFTAETKNAANALRQAAEKGFPAPDGSRMIQDIADKEFLAALTKVANTVEQNLADTRTNIGMKILENFVAANIDVPKNLDCVSPEDLQRFEQECGAGNFVAAIRTRRALREAMMEYAQNPASEEKRQEIDELVKRYAKIKIQDILLDIGNLASEGELGPRDLQMLKGLFKPKTTTESLKTQVAHFLQMVKSVTEDMKPEEFLSTTSAHTLLEGKLRFSSLVEARIHGMSDADVDPNLDDSRLVSSTVLGKGGVNTVKLVSYQGGEERVFKPEAPGRQAMDSLALSKDYASEQQVANLNFATQSAANVLGLTDVCPKCSVGVHDGEYGIFMEKAPGVEVSNFNKDAKIPPGSLSASEVRDLPEDDHAKVIGGIMRGINRLEWLDLITGQGDRHKHNYMIDVKNDLSVSVKGIDNDQCYPAYRTGLRTYVLTGKQVGHFTSMCEKLLEKYPKRCQDDVKTRILKDPGVKIVGKGKDMTVTLDTTKFKAGELQYIVRGAIGMHGTTLPGYIDEELYTQLTALKEGEKRDAYFADLSRRLPPAAVESARNRLDEAIAYAEELASKGKVVSKEDFENHEVQKKLIKPELKVGNPVKPVKDFSLNEKSDVVVYSSSQVKSFFMRDIFDVATKKGWFH